MKFTYRKNEGSYSLELELQAETIDEITSQFLDVMPKLEKTMKPYAYLLQQKAKGTCEDAVLELVKDGWFKEHKNSVQTILKLNELGCNYDKSSVGHALKNLVASNILKREGKTRKFDYLQVEGRFS